MSFPVNKNINGRIIKKTLNNNILANVTNSESLGSSYSIFNTNASSLTLNNTLVTASVSDLNKTIVTTPGVAEASKLLVLNSNKNISNINNLECNSITINGTTLNGLSSNNQNLFLNNITTGTGAASRALVLDSDRNINNINKLSINTLEIGGGTVDISGKNNKLIFNTGNISILNNWTSICWADSLNLFVAISNTGTNNRIITSTNGINWTVQISPADNNWTSICWSQQLTLLVAVSNSGIGNRIMTSPDGINWTLQTSPVDNDWTSVVWSSKLNLFVAVSNSGTNDRIMTSNNGINWITRTSPNNFSWNSICWSENLNIFTAVGYSNVVSNNLVGLIANDMTGNNSSGKIASASSYYSSVYPQYASTWDPWNAFDNDTSSTGYHSLEGQYNSSTGVYTANLTTTTDSAGIIHSGEWLQIKFSSNFIISSFSITPRTTGSNFQTQRAPRSFVLLGSNDGTSWNNIYTETNKTNWSSSAATFTITNNTNSYSYYRIVFKRLGNLDSGMSYADCINIMDWSLTSSSGISLSNSVMTSVNGIDWTLRTIDNNNWKSICWSYDLYKFVAIASSGTNRIALSSDGTNWTTYSINYNNNWNNIIWVPEYKILLASTNDTSNSIKVIYSLDGINWYPYVLPKNYNINCITYSSTLKKICCITNQSFEISADNYNAPNNNIVGIKDCVWAPSLNLYVAVGFSGKIMTSSDGITWTERTAPNQNYLMITWSPSLSLFIAVTQVTSIYITSPDGITWTQRTLPTTLWWKNIIWVSSLNLFVLNQLYGTQVYTSPDGINWTLRNTTANGLKIIWVSQLSLFIGVASNHISTSPDGITWTSRTSPENNNWVDVIYSPTLNLLVAVSNSGTNRIITSTNGITWTVRNNLQRSWKLLHWNSFLKLFIVVASNSTSNLLFGSYDGINWFYISHNIFNPISQIVFNTTNNKLLFTIDASVNNQIYLTNSLNYLIYSFVNDTYTKSEYKYNLSSNVQKIYTKKSTINYSLKNWIPIQQSISVPLVSCVWAGYPIYDFVAVSNTGNILYSNDSVTWTTSYTSANNYNSICWSPELQLFVAVGSVGSQRAITSSNGINWTLRNLNITNNWTSICWSPELMLFVAVSNNGTNRIVLSNDGITWMNYTCPLNNWTSICWSPELHLFVAVSNSGTNNRVMTSVDGTIWISRTSAADNDWTSVCWSKHLNLFVAVSNTGNNNRIMTSNNGINWISRTSPADNNWNCIIWVNQLKMFISVASSGSNRLMYSYNGIDWNLITLNINNSWTSICWSHEFNHLLMVSSDGTNRINKSYFFSSTDFNTMCLPYLEETSDFKLKYDIPYNYSGNITHQLEIGGGWLSFCNSSGSTIYQMYHDGTNLNFNQSSNFSINIADHNGIDRGLALNNTLITATGNQINSLSGIILGQAVANKALSLDSLSNISNINQLSCNTVTLNSYFNNITPGIAYPDNLLVCDSNKNIQNLNEITVNTLKLQNTVINNNNIDLSTNPLYTTVFNRSNILYNFNNGRAVVWSPELNIFVGLSASTNQSNSVAISSDGDNWYTYPLTVTNGFNNICWSSTLRLFVAVANNTNLFYYSSNGINWNTSTFSLTYTWQSVCWSNELNMFAAVARSASNGTSIATSVDGINWTSRTAPDNQWWQIIYAKNRFIVIGTIGIMTSTDGIVWTNGTVPASQNWKSITYSSSLDLFVIVSDTGSNRIATSSNLTNWTLITAPVLNQWYSVYWISELNIFISTAITGTNNRIMISNNGINWYIRSHNNQNLPFYYQIAWSPTLNKLVLSSDTNYYYIGNIKFTDNLNKNLYLDDIHKKSIKQDDIVYNIVNNWIPRNASNNLQWQSICYSTELNLFAAVSNSGINNSIMTSNDSINWTSLNSPVMQTGTTTIQVPTLTPETIDGGITFSLALMSNGTIKSWGTNTYGELGVTTNSGTNTINTTPFTVSGITNAIAISGRSSVHSLALLSNGTVMAWGENSKGQLGNSTNNLNYNPNPSPSLVSGVTNAIAISASGTYSLALRSNGTVMGWGQLGGSGASPTPVSISGVSNAIAISVGQNSAMALISDGTIKAWGVNRYSQLGNLTNYGTNTVNGTPVTIPDITNAIAISCGYHSLALLSNGTIKSWGWNSNGQLGIGTSDSDSHPTPVSVSGITNAVAISSGGFHSLALLSDGTVKAWGMNDYGQLGTGNTTNSFLPITVPGISNAIAISAGYQHSVVLLSDGTIRSWGLNRYGQLGTTTNSGTFNSNSSPINPNISNINVKTLPQIIPTYTDNNWTSICYSPELTLFVAVSNTGTGDRIMTSSDGINWTSRSNPVDNDWTSVCWSNDLSLFVAVANTGTGDRIMTSSDGINWTSRTNPVDNNWTFVCYSSELTLFVAVSNSGTNNRVMISSDGINWTSQLSAADNNWTSVCWANNINLFIAVSSSGTKRIMISENGINWKLIQDPSNNNWQEIIWINELNVAIAISNSGKNRIMISFNGYDWKLENLTIQNNFTSICWSPKLALLILISETGSNRVISSVIGYATETNAVIGYPNQLTINNVTENIGLGTNAPSYRLHLSTDSAAKLSSSTWTVGSDVRLKENIETADLDLCYENIKSLPLKRYTWKEEIYSNDQVNDRSKLGWIADDVELIFPKSVKKNNLFDIEDCKTLNNDQIIASLYGTIKKLITISEEKNNIINNLENQYNSLKSTIDSLEIVE